MIQRVCFEMSPNTTGSGFTTQWLWNSIMLYLNNSLQAGYKRGWYCFTRGYGDIITELVMSLGAIWQAKVIHYSLSARPAVLYYQFRYPLSVDSYQVTINCSSCNNSTNEMQHCSIDVTDSMSHISVLTFIVLWRMKSKQYVGTNCQQISLEKMGYWDSADRGPQMVHQYWSLEHNFWYFSYFIYTHIKYVFLKS